MKQMTFTDAEYAGKRKQTRKDEMDRVVPWKGLIALIEPHYLKGEGGVASGSKCNSQLTVFSRFVASSCK